MIRVCNSAALVDGGRGVRFSVVIGGAAVPAFVVRHDGRARAYLNRCAHVAMELDWQEGEFFDADARYLMCATHGAIYEPSSGHCAGGPCAGHGGLQPLDVHERHGAVFVALPGSAG